MSRRFPLLLGYGKERRALEEAGCPTSVDWSIVAPHEAQANRNHYQTLDRLAERGGLSPAELLAVLTDRHWRAARGDIASVPELLSLLSAAS